MKWCCVGFKANYETAGQRGVSCLIGRDSLSTPDFVLQVRAVDIGNESHIQSDAPTSIIIDIRTIFCPWCGVKLEKF